MGWGQAENKYVLDLGINLRKNLNRKRTPHISLRKGLTFTIRIAKFPFLFFAVVTHICHVDGRDIPTSRVFRVQVGAGNRYWALLQVKDEAYHVSDDFMTSLLPVREQDVTRTNSEEETK